jgi:hypothetical protein
MISENDVLLILHSDDWFSPSKSEKTKIVTNKDGNVLEVAESYYHNLDGGQIIIRVSNPNNEVDAEGYVIKVNKSFFIDKIIMETINNYLKRKLLLVS